ncbi:methyltransferase [Angustibacter peucedani]
MVAPSSDAARRPRRGDVATSPRTAAVWDVVQRTAAQLAGSPARTASTGSALEVLDAGAGTGGMAVRLAALGHRVTVVDPSPDALAALERRAEEAGVVDRVSAVQADAAQLPQVVAPSSVDLVCCHGVLEHVDEPRQAVQAVADVLRPGGAASLLVAQRSAVVLARALAGRFAEAARALDDPDGRWGEADPLPRRFDQPQLLALVEAAGLVPRQVHGVRLFSDLVPEALVDGDDARAALLDLERRAGEHPEHPELAALAVQLHVLAVRAPA